MTTGGAVVIGIWFISFLLSSFTVFFYIIGILWAVPGAFICARMAKRKGLDGARAGAPGMPSAGAKTGCGMLLRALPALPSCFCPGSMSDDDWTEEEVRIGTVREAYVWLHVLWGFLVFANVASVATVAAPVSTMQAVLVPLIVGVPALALSSLYSLKRDWSFFEEDGRREGDIFPQVRDVLPFACASASCPMYPVMVILIT